jgi:hypothetical protein
MNQTPMTSFFTREKANTGLECPLWLPNGTKSEHSIKIRGMDSDEFREAEQNAQKALALAAASDNPKEVTRVYLEQKVLLVASLIISWTFPDECNMENCVKFLTEAPQILDAINKTASNRKLFFANGSTVSSSTLKESSDSTESQVVPNNPSDKASTKSTKPPVKSRSNSKPRKSRRN